MGRDGSIPQRLAGRGVAGLPLFGTDADVATPVKAERFDPAQPWWTGGMQDLQHELIGEKASVVEVVLAAAGDAGFQSQIPLQLSHLAIGAVRIVLHPQQLPTEQGLADGQGVEGAISHEPSVGIRAKTGLMDQWCCLRIIEIPALHLPEPCKPVGIDQVVPIRGPRQGCRQRPVWPAAQAILQHGSPAG